MKVLHTYFRNEVIRSITFVMVAFVSLFLFFDMIAEVDRLSRPNASWFYYLISLGLGLPSRIYEIAPIAALIGSIYALVQLAASSEFTVMRSSGLGTAGLLRIMSRVAVGVVAITLFFGELVAPVAEKISVPIRAKGLGYELNRDFRSGYWLRDLVEDNGRQTVNFINFTDFTPDGELLGVELYTLSDEGQFNLWVRAERAAFVPDAELWVMMNATVQRFDYVPDERGGELAPRLVLRAPVFMERLNGKSGLRPEFLTGLLVKPERMSAYQLYNYSAFLSRNQLATDDIDLAFAKKVIYPFAIMVMMLISLSFAYLQVRAGGVSVKVFIGVMIGVGFHLVNSLFSHLGMVAKMPPFLSASLPTLIGLLAGLVALWWVSRPDPIHKFRKQFLKTPNISLD